VPAQESIVTSTPTPPAGAPRPTAGTPTPATAHPGPVGSAPGPTAGTPGLTAGTPGLTAGPVARPDAQIDWRVKGFWQPGSALSPDEFAAARYSLFGGAFTWPVMVARRSAIEHNIRTLADFCARRGLEFAPHGKTTMAPSLFVAQLRAGAWGITVATANQVLACRALGVPRVLLANELLDPTALRWVVREVRRGFDFLCYVDSLAGVRALVSAAQADAADAAEAAGGSRPVRVLVELGYPGGRTGCRTVPELLELARAVAREPSLELAGVAGYEGGLPGVEEVRGYLDTLRAATGELAAAGLVGDRVVVTAGGSAFFDLVAERLAGAWLPGRTVRPILRSGAYVSHDHGIYQERTPFRRLPGDGCLEAALEVWAQVTSTPEPGLAIVGMGKREVPYDEGLPVPLRVRRVDGSVGDATGLSVVRVNDHHAYVELEHGAALAPGDLLCLGISHPCTAFDKWRVVPVVEEDYTVSDLIHTYF